jgi:hypothetical protein
MNQPREALERPEAHVTFRQAGNENDKSPWTTFQTRVCWSSPVLLVCALIQLQIPTGCRRRVATKTDIDAT